MPEPTSKLDAGEESNVCVAVKLRPLVPSEVEQGCREVLDVSPDVPQISTHGGHLFTYDHVFGGLCGADPTALYQKCVSPLVEGLFKGYNATVFAYGQTGSGKTYTMGSEYRPGGARKGGVIPEAIDAIFNKISSSKDWQCSVRVSFVEIHKEEVRDLLVTGSGPRTAVSIREVLGGGVALYGAVEKEVRNQEEMASMLEMGTLCRATASTNMNNRSSRSHAIFTITLEQRRQVAGPGTPTTSGAASTGRGGGDDDDDDDSPDQADETEALDDYLCAKMNLVDLAGSERAKRTKAEGARLKEGIHINRGLLALGNVINAIVDNHKHVPYRDSKLTRLLQDSLGGNSRTVMIACVSPADVNFEETLNTMRYADRARHIRNKPVINRDPVAAQVAYLRQQIAVLRSENQALKNALTAEGKTLMAEDSGNAYSPGAGNSSWAMVEHLQEENTKLETEAMIAKVKVEDMSKELEAVKQRNFILQAQLDRVTAELRALKKQTGQEMANGDDDKENKDAGADAEGHEGMNRSSANAHDMVVAGYLSRIDELEKELIAARRFQSLRRRHHLPTVRESQTNLPTTPLASAGSASMMTPRAGSVTDMDLTPTSPSVGADGDAEPGLDGECDDEEMYYAEIAAHAIEQEKMKKEMTALQMLLENKERKMAELQQANNQGLPALKQQYDKVLTQLQRERDKLVAEKVAIQQKLQHIQATSEEERKRLEATYREKLTAMDDKLRSLRHKEREFVSMQKLKQRTDDMCRRLSSDIARIKAQKVALQKSMETNSKQFNSWRQEREKELLQLRKQARRSQAQIQALEAMQAKQNAVLQRKIADANAARKRLREIQQQQAAARAQEASHTASHGARDIRASVDALTLNNSNAVTDIQPYPGAPFLRTEDARRKWVEKELDACNQSYEYRRVLEGELAQRAEVNRQLRNVMKRLMMVNNLTPASPLLPGPGGLVTPGPGAGSAAQVSEVVVTQLQERKATLERQLAEHNMQIVELQAAWERTKSEEESRGGGAADPKRWTGIRNVVEARELLRSVFRLACDLKAGSADTSMESLKVTEELDLLRVQLDAAKKEAEAHRKRAAAIEATAASAMATPLGGGPLMRRVQDETDQEVDDLLQQLQRAKSPTGLVCIDEEGVRLGSPTESMDGNNIPAHTSQHTLPSSSAEALAQLQHDVRPSQIDTRTLDQGSNQQQGSNNNNSKTGRRNHRAASKTPEEKELQGRYAADSSDHDMDCDDPVSETEDDVDEEAGSEDDTGDDDPEYQPTPRHTARNAQRTSGRHTRTSNAAASELATTSSRPGSSSSIPDLSLLHGGGASGNRGGSNRRRSNSVNPGDPHAHEREAAILSDMNTRLSQRGQPSVFKLTVNLLKEHLKDRTMPDGKVWRAGSKTKDQLIADYLAILGHGSQQPTPRSTPGPIPDLSPVNTSNEPSPKANSQPQHNHSTSSTNTHAADKVMYINRMFASNGVPEPDLGGRAPRNALGRSVEDLPLHKKAMSSGSIPSLSPLSIPGDSPSPRMYSPLGRPATEAEEPLGFTGFHNSLAGQDQGQGQGQGSSNAMSPMASLYIQKAQEARKRMENLRQSIHTNNAPNNALRSSMPSPAAMFSSGAWAVDKSILATNRTASAVEMTSCGLNGTKADDRAIGSPSRPRSHGNTQDQGDVSMSPMPAHGDFRSPAKGMGAMDMDTSSPRAMQISPVPSRNGSAQGASSGSANDLRCSKQHPMRASGNSPLSSLRKSGVWR